MTDRSNYNQLERQVDAFEAEVRQRRAELCAPLDADGFRRSTAAALLFRGLELLGALRACDGDDRRPARELLLRSTVEVALRGRFLLGPLGDDELTRTAAWFLFKGAKKANNLKTTFGGLSPEFVTAVLPEVATEPSKATEKPTVPESWDLFSVATALDKDAKFDRTARGSAVEAYHALYAPLSDSAVHAGIAALRRFTVTTEGKACVVAHPEPLLTGPRLHLIAAGLLGDLALEVFAAFDLSTAALVETDVAWVYAPS